MLTFLCIWLLFGYISSLFAVYIFRRDGTTNKERELYWAVTAPFFGPVIGILIVIDLLKEKK